MPVAEFKIIPGDAHLPAAPRHDEGVNEEIPDAPPERARVPADRAADGSRYSGQEFETLPSILNGEFDQLGHRRSRRGRQTVSGSAPNEPLSRVLEDEPAKSVVIEQDIEASADDIERDLGVAGGPDGGLKFRPRLRLEEKIRRPADPEIRMIPQSDAFPERPADGLEKDA